MAPGATELRVCVFGTFDADRHPRVAIIEEGLSAHGVVLRRCNVSWDAPTDLRVAALRRPWIGLLLAFRLLVAWWRLVRAAREVGPVDVVVVGYLGVLDVHLARWLWRDAEIVLDHLAPATGTVDDRLGRTSLRGRLAAAVDRRAAARADVVLVDTEEHLPQGDDVEALVVPVGAASPWFASRRTLGPAAPSPLTVVFYGLYTPLQGAPVIAAALRELHDAGVAITATMIGRGQELPVCRQIVGDRPGVVWRDWVEPDRLPDLVAAHDVCLGIFGTTAKAARVVPNKVFQGAAAGCAIVTSGTRPQRRALGDAAAFVPAGDAAALAGELARLAERPDAVADLRRAAADRADRDFRPEAVVVPLLSNLLATDDVTDHR